MKEDLKTLCDKITELANNFVLETTFKAYSPEQPVFVSLLHAAPEGMTKQDIEKYLPLILSELRSRPELNNVRLPQNANERGISKRLSGEMSLVVSCQPEYCIPGGKDAHMKLSLARLAEVGEKALEYVREEAQDFAQDMTERLGLSIEELYRLEPQLDPAQYLKFVLEERDEKSGEPFIRLFDSIEDAIDAWADTPDNPLRIYADTRYGEFPIVRQSWDGNDDISVPLEISISQADFTSIKDYPDNLIQQLKHALSVSSQLFPYEIGLPGRLNQENVPGLTMYISERSIYGELLNLHQMKCTGYDPNEDMFRFTGRKTDHLGNDTSYLKFVKREDVILTEEEALDRADSELDWVNRKGRYSKLAVTHDTANGNIVVEPLEISEDKWTGRVSLRHWTKEFPIELTQMANRSTYVEGSKRTHIFDITELDQAISLTASLMSPYIHIPDQTHNPVSLADKLQDAQNRTGTPTPESIGIPVTSRE